MSAIFNVQNVWDLGETIHVIGIIADGVIKGGEVLRSEQGGIEIRVLSVALGGGTNLPEDAITLVIESLPCPIDKLVGQSLAVVEH